MVTNPNASDIEKTNRLIDGHPWAQEAYFVQDMSQSVHAFIGTLRSVAVEYAYNQSTAIKGFESVALAAPAIAQIAIALVLALQYLLQAPDRTVAVLAYTNMICNAPL